MCTADIIKANRQRVTARNRVHIPQPKIRVSAFNRYDTRVRKEIRFKSVKCMHYDYLSVKSQFLLFIFIFITIFTANPITV